jgi:hypothetical protein
MVKNKPVISDINYKPYMQKIICFLIIIASAFPALAQVQLPQNACGIVNVYDNAGNRTKRVYFCNNGPAYPARKAQSTEVVQQVDALYPNPTTGKFVVTFSRALQKAQVLMMDVNGKTISRFVANGNLIEFDLSSSPGGIYFIRIDDAGNVILKKVVKQ